MTAKMISDSPVTTQAFGQWVSSAQGENQESVANHILSHIHVRPRIERPIPLSIIFKFYILVFYKNSGIYKIHFPFPLDLQLRLSIIPDIVATDF